MSVRLYKLDSVPLQSYTIERGGICVLGAYAHMLYNRR